MPPCCRSICYFALPALRDPLDVQHVFQVSWPAGRHRRQLLLARGLVPARPLLQGSQV